MTRGSIPILITRLFVDVIEIVLGDDDLGESDSVYIWSGSDNLLFSDR